MPHSQPFACPALRRSVAALVFTAVLGLAVLFCLGAPENALAAQGFSAFKISDEDNRERTWTLNAGRMSSLAGGDILEAYENVEVRMGDDFMISDYARYYPKSGWIYISGNVRMRMGGDELKAESAEFNLESRTGWLTDGVIFLSGPHAYFAGERINKHWGDVYSFRNAKITTCDGDVPAWSLSADSAVVELDGYAQLWGTSFKVMDFPVVYSPFMIMPAKTDRQTGLLRPDFGHSSERGYFYNQPFFWAIDSSRDLTFNENYMSERGFMHGLTYRSRGSEDEKLWFRVDYLHDRSRITDDSQGKYSGDGLVRTNVDRWWVRGMYDWRLPLDEQWRLRADIDLVSDQDYLREYDFGMSGFDKSREDLFDWFSRDLQERDRDRVSGVMIFREWQRAGAYLSGTYTQNPRLGHGNRSRNSDTTVQTLPSLDLFLHKGRLIEDLPLEIEGSAQAAYKYRREGTSGARYDLVPKISLPLNSEYGSIIASAAIRGTWYSTEATGHADTPAQERVKSDLQRILPEFDVKASSQIDRVYDFDYEELSTPGDSHWVALKHSLLPRVSYRNRPHDDQHGNPVYDSYDRLDSQNELTYSLENVFTRKRERLLSRTTPEGEEETYTRIDYLDVLRLRLEQTYDIRESRRDWNRGQYSRKPFRDIMAEAAFSWDGYWTLSSKTFWSPYSGNITRQDGGLGLNVPQLGNVYAGLTYRDKLNDYFTQRNTRLSQVNLRGNLDLYGPWSASFYYDWSIHGSGEEERGLNIFYTHQCFQLIGSFIKDQDDTIFRFSILLNGLGTVY